MNPGWLIYKGITHVDFRCKKVIWQIYCCWCCGIDVFKTDSGKVKYFPAVSWGTRSLLEKVLSCVVVLTLLIVFNVTKLLK